MESKLWNSLTTSLASIYLKIITHNQPLFGISKDGVAGKPTQQSKLRSFVPNLKTIFISQAISLLNEIMMD